MTRSHSSAVLVFVASASLISACSTAPQCSASSCPLGCCDASGECQTATNLACGASGAACMACGLGQTCFTGVCTSGNGAGGGGGGGSASGGGSATGGGGSATGGGGSATGGGGSATGGGGMTGGGGGTTVDCAQQVTELRGSGGCVLTIVAPANCATVDFSAGYVELAYTTFNPGSGFTFCEGPHHLFLLGHPASTWTVGTGNGMDISLTSTGGNFVSIGSNGSTYSMTRDNGGVLRLVRADLAPLTSPNGQFHFMVTGFYDLANGGSRSASHTFVVP